jgi:glutathione S-transferase
LTDTFTDGQQIRLFESGSIMQYLVDQYDKEHKLSYPQGSREYYETNNCLYPNSPFSVAEKGNAVLIPV